MKLYHFTTARAKYFMTEGKFCESDTSLKPNDESPRIVDERRRDFFDNPKARWYCTEDRTSAMDNIKKWRKSKELGRLLYNLQLSEEVFFEGFALLSFETAPNDRIWVCEADWLRQYHDGTLDTYDAHMKFALSRVKLSEYNGNFKLPEFIIGNSISKKRIRWKRFPKGLKPIELKTRPSSEPIPIREY